MRAPPFPREIIPQPAGFHCRAAPSTRPCNPAVSLAETGAGLSPAVDNKLTQPRQRRRPAPPADAAAAGSLPPSFHHHHPTPSFLAQQRGEQMREPTARPGKARAHPGDGKGQVCSPHRRLHRMLWVVGSCNTVRFALHGCTSVWSSNLLM